MKYSEYETDFEEISVPFNEKNILGTKRKIENAARQRSFQNAFQRITWTNCWVPIFFNIYVNDYIDIDEHISSGGYNIYTLYNYFWGLEWITQIIR